MTSSIRTRFLRSYLLIGLILFVNNISLLIGHSLLVRQYNNVIDLMSNQYQLNQSVANLINNYNDIIRGNDATTNSNNPKIKGIEAQINTKVSFLNATIVDPQAKASFLGFQSSIQNVVKEVNGGLDDFAQGKGTTTEHYLAANRDYGFVQTNSTTFTFDQLHYVSTVEAKLHSNYRRLQYAASSFVVFLALAGTVYAVRFAKKITQPIKELTKVAEQIAADKMDVTIPQSLLQNQDETGSLSNSFNVMFARLKEKIQELNDAKESVEKQVEQRTHQLHEEQAKLLASIQGLPAGIVLSDPSGKILLQNGRLLSIFGLSQQPHTVADLGKNLNGLDLAIAFNNVLKTRKPQQFNEVSMNSSILRLFIGPVTVVENNVEQIIGTVMLSEDITEAKILDRSKDEFFSIASHELRTPLTAIRGNTAMIQQYFPDAMKDQSLKEMVGDIYGSSTRLIDIVNDFLDLSRLEQGKMTFKLEEFEIEPIIESVVYEMRTVLGTKDLYLKFDRMTLGSLPKVVGDKDRVKQIIYNLVGNASKFTEKGGISINSEHDPKFVKILVVDTGRGISPEGQKLLFHKFQQTGSSLLTRDTTRGTGLGLYISKILVEKMGGKIALERSEEGKGSTFSFTIPIVNSKTLEDTHTQTDVKTGMSVQVKEA